MKPKISNKKSSKAIWIGALIGGITGIVYSLISLFFIYIYNIDGTPLEFLMPIISPMWILSYMLNPLFATAIFIVVGAFIGFIIKNYKEIGIAILIGVFLSFVALYSVGIFLKDTAPIVWIAPLILIICLLGGLIIRKRRKAKGKNEQ